VREIGGKGQIISGPVSFLCRKGQNWGGCKVGMCGDKGQRDKYGGEKGGKKM